MDDDVFNMSIRKYLKKVGVTAQRQIEQAVREAIAAGVLTGSETLPITIELKLAAIDLALQIDGELQLE